MFCGSEFSKKVKNLTLALERKFKENKEARTKKGDTQSEDSKCKICFEGKQEYAFIKCGHVVCADCKPKLSLCPICRARIEGTLKIFIQK